MKQIKQDHIIIDFSVKETKILEKISLCVDSIPELLFINFNCNVDETKQLLEYLKVDCDLKIRIMTFNRDEIILLKFICLLDLSITELLYNVHNIDKDTTKNFLYDLQDVLI